MLDTNALAYFVPQLVTKARSWMKWPPGHATEEDASLNTFRNAINKK
jgi:hypothetical protein